jgi:hypothetical protein
MLQAYKVRTYIAVNDNPKKEIWRIGYGLTEDELPRVITTTFSFQDCFDNQLQTPAITTHKTFFRKRPYVRIEYDWEDVKYYYDFDSITIERHYELYDITLNELFKSYSADQCIQYLKERDMTTCQILK